MPYDLLLKSLSFLAFIVALIYLCFYLYKKKSGMFLSKETRISILEKRSIDPRTSISLVRIDEREVIIVSHQSGVSVHGVPDAVMPKSFKEMLATKSAVH